ncbi:MAG: zinc ribbon domain-containing protein [Clostridia bacterium]|nr:zinc ribbon domain-containing protein [Clostridia bacterium]MBO7658807.1 zinc ribbon domain-containing protein [Clostridia bacterium]
MTDEIKEEVVENETENDTQDINDNKGLTILAYIGPLVFIPMFVRKNSKFARFHCNQGLILFILEAAAATLSSILSAILWKVAWLSYLLTLPCWAVEVACVVLSVLGIIAVAKGQYKELPIIGKYKILK